MERNKLNVKLKDRIHNIIIRQGTRVTVNYTIQNGTGLDTSPE